MDEAVEPPSPPRLVAPEVPASPERAKAPALTSPMAEEPSVARSVVASLGDVSDSIPELEDPVVELEPSESELVPGLLSGAVNESRPPAAPLFSSELSPSEPAEPEEVPLSNEPVVDPEPTEEPEPEDEPPVVV